MTEHVNSVLLGMNVLQIIERNIVSRSYIWMFMKLIVFSVIIFNVGPFAVPPGNVCVCFIVFDIPFILYDTPRATPIIICRFILDLRQVKVSDSSQNSRTQPSSIRFVGNAGESLQFEDDGDEEELSIHADDFDSPHGVDDIGVNRSTTSGMTASSFDSHTVSIMCYFEARSLVGGL